MAISNALLSGSRVSEPINTSFVERQNGTDRGLSSRKARKTYGFSKEWDLHNADGQWLPRTPAMAAGLVDQVWTTEEWVTYPAKGPSRFSDTTKRPSPPDDPTRAATTLGGGELVVEALEGFHNKISRIQDLRQADPGLDRCSKRRNLTFSGPNSGVDSTEGE